MLGRPRTSKRRQRARKPWDGAPRDQKPVGAKQVQVSEAVRACREGKTRRPTGVEGQGERAQGSHRDLGGFAVSTKESRRRGSPGEQVSRRTRAALRLRASKRVSASRYRGRYQPKDRETDGEESERFVVPPKQGQWTRRPCGGKGAPGMEAVHPNAAAGPEPAHSLTVRCTGSDQPVVASLSQRAPFLTSRMRELRTSGSVGGRGEQSPRPTRPGVDVSSPQARLRARPR